MLRKYMIGVIQMDTRDNYEENMEAACRFIDEAAAKGAKLVAFPEVFNYIGNDPRDPEEIPGGPTISLMAKKAKEHHIWIHCGSISEVNPNGEKKYNTTVLLNPEGEEVARYRKLHAFDPFRQRRFTHKNGIHFCQRRTRALRTLPLVCRPPWQL